MSIKVLINGVLGRMGRTVLSATVADQDVVPIGGVDISAPQGKSYTDVGTHESRIPVFQTFDKSLLDLKPQVIVDFTNREGFLNTVNVASDNGINVVSGSTGILKEDYIQVEELSRKGNIQIIHAPNFALGAVILEWLAKSASPYFEFAQIIESHHELKKDAPSGTAISIAAAMASAKQTDFKSNIPEQILIQNSMGGQKSGISIYSSRMPGRIARHEVVFGATGQTLSILHDTINREAFMPGVLISVKKVESLIGLTSGLDTVLGLNN